MSPVLNLANLQQQSKEPADTEWLETYTWYKDELNVFFFPVFRQANNDIPWYTVLRVYFMWT